jgi:hypothetical protein
MMRINIYIKNLILTSGVFLPPAILFFQGEKINWYIFILLYLGLNIVLDIFDFTFHRNMH